MLQGPLTSAQQTFYTICFFLNKPVYFLFEIYMKQLNSKSVRFHFFHQSSLIMSGESALTTPVLWFSQPQELVLQHQTSSAEPWLCHMPYKGCLCCELSVSSPSHPEVPPKGPAWAETHTYLFTLILLFPKKQELRLLHVLGRLFQLYSAGEGGKPQHLHIGEAFYGVLNNV